MTSTILKYDAMCAAIEKARTLDDVQEIRDRAVALLHYKRIATDETALRQVSEIKARAERRAGEMLDEAAKRGERKSDGQPKKNGPSEVTVLPTLKDLGVSKRQSSDWQKIARIPEAKFEKVLATAPKPVTTKALLAEAPKPTTSKTGVVQPKDDTDMLAARDKRRATAARMIVAGYEALKAKDGDSAHFRTVQDSLLRLGKGLA